MRLWWCGLCMAVSGCVSMSAMKEAVYPELAELELYRQGSEIFCAEPAFLACANLSRQACSEEGRGYTHDCIVAAKAGQGEIAGQAGAEAMIERFSSCMANRMLASRHSSEMEHCFDGIAQH